MSLLSLYKILLQFTENQMISFNQLHMKNFVFLQNNTSSRNLPTKIDKGIARRNLIDEFPVQFRYVN